MRLRPRRNRYIPGGADSGGWSTCGSCRSRSEHIARRIVLRAAFVSICLALVALPSRAQTTIEQIEYPVSIISAALRLNDRGDVGGLVIDNDGRAVISRLRAGATVRIPFDLNANLTLVGIESGGEVTVAAAGGELPADTTRLFRITPSTGAVSVFDLPVVYNPRGFSDSGQFVATVIVQGRARCARYTPGVGLELLPLIGFQSMPVSINARGDVAALVNFNAFFTASARYRDGEGWRVVFVPGQQNNQPAAMNGNGDLVGWTFASSGQIGLPFLAVDSTTATTLEPTQGAIRGFSRAINDNRWVIGQLAYRDYFLWTPKHGMYPLANLLPPGSGWTIGDAQDINNAGEIVGFGARDGTFGSIYLLRLNGQTSPALSASQLFGPNTP